MLYLFLTFMLVFSDSELRNCVFPLLTQLFRASWGPAASMQVKSEHKTPGFLGTITYLSSEMPG